MADRDGFYESWRDARSRRTYAREIIEVVRAKSAGKTKDEIRELLSTEIQARGGPLPPPAVLDLMAEHVLSGGGVADWLRLTVRGVSMLKGMITETIRDVKDQFLGMGSNLELDREPLLVQSDRSRPAADVVVYEEAEPTLASPGEIIPDFSEIFVLLVSAEGENSENQVEVQTGGRNRIGMLNISDSAEFADILGAGSLRNQPVVGEAIRERTEEGNWRLRVYRPVPGASV